MLLILCVSLVVAVKYKFTVTNSWQMYHWFLETTYFKSLLILPKQVMDQFSEMGESIVLVVTVMLLVW